MYPSGLIFERLGKRKADCEWTRLPLTDRGKVAHATMSRYFKSFRPEIFRGVVIECEYAFYRALELEDSAQGAELIVEAVGRAE